MASWLSPLVSVVRVADGETWTRPACVNVLLVAATAPDVDGPRTATIFLSDTNFWVTVWATEGPASTGTSPGTSLILRPIVGGSVLTASFAQESCSWPRKPAAPVSGARKPMSSVPEQLIACERCVAAPAGAAVTVAASAVAAATAASSGNDLVFFMDELLVGGSEADGASGG